MSDTRRTAVRCVLAGGVGGVLPVLALEVQRGSSPLFVVQELVGLLLGAALLAGAAAAGARAGAASSATRALTAAGVLVLAGVALALLSPPWVVLAVPCALLPVAAGLVLAQLGSEPTPGRAFHLATWGAVVGLVALNILRSSPWGADLVELAPHVPLLFGVWGIVFGLVLASGDGRELKGDLPLGSGALFLLTWAMSGTVGYATDRQALSAGDPATRARALASMSDSNYLWSLELTLRGPSGDDRPEIGEALVGLFVQRVTLWPRGVDAPPPGEVRCDLLRALGEHARKRRSNGKDEGRSTIRAIESQARFHPDPAVRRVAVETLVRLDPAWRDPLEVWVSDPDPDKRAIAFFALSPELHRCSAADLSKLVSRAGEVPAGELGRLIGIVESVATSDRSAIARALLDGAAARLDAHDRARLEKLVAPPAPEPFR